VRLSLSRPITTRCYRPPPPLDLDDASIPVKVRSATPLRQLRGRICGSDKGTSQRPRLDRGLSGASPRLGLHRCPHWPEHHRHPLGLASRRRRSFIRTRRLPTSFRSTPSGYPRDKSLRGEGRGRLGRGQRRPRPPTPCSCPALPPAGNAPAPVPGRSPVASLMLGPRIRESGPNRGGPSPTADLERSSHRKEQREILTARGQERVFLKKTDLRGVAPGSANVLRS
jgi:hypothetical protein